MRLVLNIQLATCTRSAIIAIVKFKFCRCYVRGIYDPMFPRQKMVPEFRTRNVGPSLAHQTQQKAELVGLPETWRLTIQATPFDCFNQMNRDN